MVSSFAELWCAQVDRRTLVESALAGRRSATPPLFAAQAWTVAVFAE